MMNILAVFLSAVVGYLLGSLTFATVVSSLMKKQDVRQLGSGNAGMTNVLRNFGIGPASLTAIGDFGKGVLAVLAGWLICSLLTDINPIWGQYIGGAAAILGHIFPVYFGFKGGKAVLVSAGVILVTQPLTLVALLLIFLLIVKLSKYVSLASITVAITYPVLTIVNHFVTRQTIWIDTIFATYVAVLVVYLHRSNIKRLLNGTENRVGQKKKEDNSAL